MIIPIRTDYRMRHRPVVNYAILAANVILFLMGFNGLGPVNSDKIQPWLLHPNLPQLHQFFSSVFLHADWAHLIGNMVFLWVFGNAVNDRFGQVGYLAFYLAGGVLACVGYLVLGATAPVLGASGAISAVTGAYLVLLPRARVTVLLWFYVITTFELSSMFFLLFQMIHNLWMSFWTTSLASGGGVAYNAHLSGYAFGIGISVVLLVTRLLPRGAFDMLNVFSAARRKRRFRRMVDHGYSPFRPADPGQELRDRPKRRVASRTVSADAPDSVAGGELKLRHQIREACSMHDLPAAAEKYLQLIEMSDRAVLSRQNQLDVANQLMAGEQYNEAAGAYERFLEYYDNYEHAADIHLMLGLIYGRYLRQYDKAEPLLERAMQSLTDTPKRELARIELQNVRRRRDE